jgi:hypothetical protein
MCPVPYLSPLDRPKRKFKGVLSHTSWSAPCSSDDIHMPAEETKVLICLRDVLLSMISSKISLPKLRFLIFVQSNYVLVPNCFFFGGGVVLGLELRASCLLGSRQALYHLSHSISPPNCFVIGLSVHVHCIHV